MSDAILKRIVEQYRPHNTYLAFREGYEAYRTVGRAWDNPYPDGVEAQAWDRGACAAMQYQRALDHLDAHPAGDEPAAEPGWLARLVRAGRC
jgi:hypothetical protein